MNLKCLPLWGLALYLAVAMLGAGCKDGGRRSGAGCWISGTVKTAEGGVVARAVVLVDGVGVHCIADDRGRYRVGPLQPGTYALVSNCPAYRPATRFSIELQKDQRLEGVDFEMRVDPNWVSDSIKIVTAKPERGSIVRAGTNVRFEITARCQLVNVPFAKVKFTVQDENERPLIRHPYDTIITRNDKRAEEIVRFVRTVRIPDRVAGKLFIAGVLLPEDDELHPVFDFVSYEVRRYEDNAQLMRVQVKKTDEDAAERVTVQVDVAYKLDLLEEARLKIALFAAYRSKEQADLLKEEEHTVKKATLAAGTHVFSVPLELPPDATAVVVRVGLIAVPSGDVVIRGAYKPVPVPGSTTAPMVILGAEEKAH